MSQQNQTETREETSSYTPGPWSVGHVRPQGVHKSLQPMWEAPIHVGEGTTRGNCHTIVYGGGLGAGSSTEEDVRANARLIAAAPDLLAALQAAQNRLELIDGNDEPAVAVRHIIGNALAKSVGA